MRRDDLSLVLPLSAVAEPSSINAKRHPEADGVSRNELLSLRAALDPHPVEGAVHERE
jgi:hypothetical protein